MGNKNEKQKTNSIRSDGLVLPLHWLGTGESWHQGIDKHFKGARGFFTVIIFSASIGVLLNFLNVNPIKAIYWTAIINGLQAPFLLIGILLVSSDKKNIWKQMPSKLYFILMVLVTLLMLGAGIGMFVFKILVGLNNFCWHPYFSFFRFDLEA